MPGSFGKPYETCFRPQAPSADFDDDRAIGIADAVILRTQAEAGRWFSGLSAVYRLRNAQSATISLIVTTRSFGQFNRTRDRPCIRIRGGLPKVFMLAARA